MHSTKKNLILALFTLGICSILSADAPAKKTKKEYEFIDERIVEHSFLLERKATSIGKYSANPIIKGSNGVCGVVKDKTGLIRMWYVGRTPIQGESPHNGRIPLGERTIRYAESKDGLNWNFPNLKLVNFRDSKDNNIIISEETVDKNGEKLSAGKRGLECPCIALTEGAPHAKGKYTLFSRCLRGFAYSDDGLQWTNYKKNPELNDFMWSDTYNNFFYDKRIGKYVLYHRPLPDFHAGWPCANRLIARVESSDLISWDWDDLRCVLDTDGRDGPAVSSRLERLIAKGVDVKNLEKNIVRRKLRGRDVQIERMTVAPYKSIYLGFAGIFDDRKSGIYHTYLLHSYDGINWIREPDNAPFIPSGKFGEWDSGIVGTVPEGCPIKVGDKLIFYYTGSNMTHGYRMMTKDKLESRNIGVGYIKSGRFVGYHAAKVKGELLTRPFLLDGKNLTLNANAPRGQIRVGIAYANGKPVKGYGKNDFIVLSGDALDLPLKWKGKEDLAELSGKKIRLRIEVDNGAIYGFAIKYSTANKK